jgi:hypothetical protein
MQVTVGGIDEYINVCCFCGCALRLEEVAARMQGMYQDFVYRNPPVDACLVFCPDCKEKVEMYANDTVQKAWFRMQQLDRQ